MIRLELLPHSWCCWSTVWVWHNANNEKGSIYAWRQ